jgi:uncharacterized membrane protein
MELAGLLAKHFGGALPFSDLEQKTHRQLMRYYRVYERQAVEEAVRNEFIHPATGKPRSLPKPQRMRELVDERIKEWREKQSKE